jgi:hypothetical protein
MKIASAADRASRTGNSNMPTIRLSKPVSQQGCLIFYLHTSRNWSDGADARPLDQTLVRLPGLADCKLTCSPESVNLVFEWGKRQYNRGFLVNLTHLPGPQTYCIIFTWNSAKGRCDGYLNGVPMNLPGTRYKPWHIDGHADRVILGRGPNRVFDVRLDPDYRAPKAISGIVPPTLAGKYKALLGYSQPPAPIRIGSRRGKLLYSQRLNNKTDISKWIMEGPGKITFTDAAMKLQTQPAGTFAGPGHFVLWCPRTFPNRFIADWQFKPLRRTGLAIIFFAARGANGDDIFNPHLPPRDGIFSQYTHGAIVSYHFSYFANLPLFQSGRPSSNLRKNNQFYLTAVGPVAVAPGSRGFQKLRIIKDGRHIQLLVNGKVSLDWTDNDPRRFGRPYGIGKIGFRQMAGTVGEYRDFKVWALKSPK